MNGETLSFIGFSLGEIPSGIIRFTYDMRRMRAGVLSAFTGTPAGDLGLIQAITIVLGVVITTKQVS